ncbi:MAG: MerR family transcriptional regulator [Anaerolineales bacterium]|nr:MerR family transcriptional regulator [Anaerolineales bacterium]
MNYLPEMHGGNEEPLYNIGVVSRMTGISMATLRAWERRYAFPDSERTAGGHRLYSERDILQLRWVKSRIEEGMQTAQAVNALRHQEKNGRLMLTEQAIARLEAPREGSRPLLGAIQSRLTDALLHHNLTLADEILAEALGFTQPEEVILHVIAPVMDKIGEGWEENKIGVADEHLATSYLRQRLVLWMLTGPPPQSRLPIVLACAPDEWHEGSLLLLGALLRRRRWPVAYLGQSLPLAELARFVGEMKPNLVVLVAMTEAPAKALAEWPQWLPEAAHSGRPVIGYGGRLFVQNPEWRMKVAGVYLGNTFEEGLAAIERMLL